MEMPYHNLRAKILIDAWHAAPWWAPRYGVKCSCFETWDRAQISGYYAISNTTWQNKNSHAKLM